MTRRASAAIGIGSLALLALLIDSDGTSTPPTSLSQNEPRQPLQRTGPARFVAEVVPHAVMAPAQLPTWASDQLLVSVVGDVEAVAADYDATVVRPVGRSGYAVLATQDGASSGDLQHQLQADARVMSVGGHAMISGAGKGGKKPGSGDDGGTGGGSGGDGGSSGGATGAPFDAQWHLADIAADSAPEGDVRDVVVAVLDTGVAYEDHVDTTGTYLQAPSLRSSAIVAPHDFVHNDAHANDDHMHGTHIASIIASDGAVRGVAPGVGLMPLKVLDETNSGYELDLVEAIYWAVDQGADVINMSLSFGEGYVPSPALMDALSYASNANVVLVAATGNQALSTVSWPAASPLVISVSAGCRNASTDVAAEYANLGAGVTLLSTGGCLDRDTNADGFADGILAETIAPGDPLKVGYWFSAGTSQAAATVSAAAARLVARGMSAAAIGPHLERTADGSFGGDSYKKGMGAGMLRVAHAESAATQPVDRAFVGMLPYLRDNGDGTVEPVVQLRVLNGELNPVGAAKVNGRIEGASAENFECNLRKSDKGVCEVTGPAVASTDAQGQPAALAWSVEIGGVRMNEVNVPPSLVVFASDGLEEIVASQDPELEDALLGFHLASGTDPDLGAVAEAYTVVNSGAGVSTSPFGVIFTPRLVEGLATEEVVVGGSGVSTSPFGFRLLTFDDVSLFDGSGVSTSPFGFTSLRISAFDGSGVSTSPFGIYTTLAGLGDSCSSCLYDGEPVVLSEGAVAGASGTALSAFVANGAWSTAEGYQAGSLLGSSLEVQPEVIGSGSGLGLSSWP